MDSKRVGIEPETDNLFPKSHENNVYLQFTFFVGTPMKRTDELAAQN